MSYWFSLASKSLLRKGFVRYNVSMKREAKFTTRFKKWLSANSELIKFPPAAAIEVKITNGKSIPFSAVKQHQVDALLSVEDGEFSYKLPDAGWQNPFDMLYMRRCSGYVVLAFEHVLPKKVVHFYIIPIHVFIDMQEDTFSKSVNEDMLYEQEIKMYSF